MSREWAMRRDMAGGLCRGYLAQRMKRSPPQPSVVRCSTRVRPQLCGAVMQRETWNSLPSATAIIAATHGSTGMRNLIIANMAWNALFIAMAASEMLGPEPRSTKICRGGSSGWWIVCARGRQPRHPHHAVAPVREDCNSCGAPQWLIAIQHPPRCSSPRFEAALRRLPRLVG